MNITPDNPFLLSSISVESLASYLDQRGWQRDSSPTDRFQVFLGPNDDHGETIELVLPQHTQGRDVSVRLAEAVNLLAAIEEKSPYDILRAIYRQDRDVLSLELITPDGNDAVITLPHAASIITGLYNVIVFAACAEDTALPFFESALPAGRDYAARCQFGHTFLDTAGFTVESPLPLHHYDRPFERRVMERVAHGFFTLGTALAQGDVDILVEDYPVGFPANLYEILADMLNQIPDTIQRYTITWASCIPPAEGVSMVQAIDLDTSAYPLLREAAAKLRQMPNGRPARLTNLVG